MFFERELFYCDPCQRWVLELTVEYGLCPECAARMDKKFTDFMNSLLESEAQYMDSRTEGCFVSEWRQEPDRKKAV